VRLTEHGIALLDRAEGLMTQLKSIEQDMLGQATEPSGEVRIALPPTTAQVLAPLIVAEARKKFPRIKLHIREGISGSIHDWVLEGRVDLALLYNPEAGAELQITPVLREPIFLIVPTSHMPLPASMTKNGHFRLKQISCVPLILPSHSHSLRTLLERLSREHRLSLNIVNEIDGMRATKGMVEAGLGYTAFSYAGVYEEVSAGTLAIIPFTPALQWTLSIVERHSAASRALFEVKRCIEKQVYVLLERGFSQGQLL
jgi:LysR family nitrogen assimilation transcriptional regulator